MQGLNSLIWPSDIHWYWKRPSYIKTYFLQNFFILHALAKRKIDSTMISKSQDNVSPRDWCKNGLGVNEDWVTILQDHFGHFAAFWCIFLVPSIALATEMAVSQSKCLPMCFNKLESNMIYISGRWHGGNGMPISIGYQWQQHNLLQLDLLPMTMLTINYVLSEFSFNLCLSIHSIHSEYFWWGVVLIKT